MPKNKKINGNKPKKQIKVKCHCSRARLLIRVMSGNRQCVSTRGLANVLCVSVFKADVP